MQFCNECNNLLYAKENRELKKLFLACRNCGHEEQAQVAMVYINEIQKAGPGGDIMVNRELTMDPTLPRTKETDCERCHNNEAVFFCPYDENMELKFVCCNVDCHHVWSERKREEERKTQPQT